jgi:hypothetical protein
MDLILAAAEYVECKCSNDREKAEKPKVRGSGLAVPGSCPCRGSSCMVSASLRASSGGDCPLVCSEAASSLICFVPGCCDSAPSWAAHGWSLPYPWSSRRRLGLRCSGPKAVSRKIEKVAPAKVPADLVRASKSKSHATAGEPSIPFLITGDLMFRGRLGLQLHRVHFDQNPCTFRHPKI